MFRRVNSECAHQARPPLGRLQPPSSVGKPLANTQDSFSNENARQRSPHTHRAGRVNRGEICNLTIGVWGVGISENEQIASVREFMQSLPATMRA
jgi:hypothetical protein